jgi:hypothetical protein
MKTIALLLLFTAFASHAATRPTTFAEPGDPERWYKPASTSELKYQNAMREAKSALSEALADCRKAKRRDACAANARARYRSDVEYAKDLRPTRLLA